MFSQLTDGVMGATTNISLLTSDYKYSRLVRLFVPKAGSGQAIYGTFRQIGTPVIGIHAGSNPYNGSTSARRRFANGYGWERSPSTLEDGGPHGVTSVRSFGVVQRWRLPYEAARWWDIDMVENVFGDDPRQAFCFVHSGEDPESAELVRDTGLSPRTHRSGDRFDYAKELVQVP